jgi:hypothetical protein
MTTSNRQSAQMLATAADFLAQGRSVNRLSLAITAIALAVLLVPPFAAAALGAAIVVIFGVAELFCALRVSFDAALFRRLADEAADDRLDLTTFDNALRALRLMRARKTGQRIGDRFARARRLLIAQGVAVFLQLVTAMVTGLFNYWAQFA